MTRLSEIIGQDPAIAMLREAARAERLPHALLFVGPDGVGKKTTAIALAAFLLCASRGADACGKCDACRDVDAGIHPDLRIEGLVPEKRDLSIEQVRELQVLLGQTALLGAKKIVIVDDAQFLSEAAQNSFLKTLEDPPGDALIVLVAHSESGLLPTVRSRCQRFSFRPLTPTAIERLLREKHGRSTDDARLLALYCDGSLGLSTRIDVVALREILDGIQGLLRKTDGGGYRGIAEASKATVPAKLEVKKRTNEAPRAEPPKLPWKNPLDRRMDSSNLEVLVELLRRGLRAAAGVEAVTELTAQGKTESLGQALRRAEAAYRALVDLGRNAHGALTVERMWIRLADDRA